MWVEGIIYAEVRGQLVEAVLCVPHVAVGMELRMSPSPVEPLPLQLPPSLTSSLFPNVSVCSSG